MEKHSLYFKFSIQFGKVILNFGGLYKGGSYDFRLKGLVIKKMLAKKDFLDNFSKWTIKELEYGSYIGLYECKYFSNKNIPDNFIDQCYLKKYKLFKFNKRRTKIIIFKVN
ncbi:hypothetical protein H3N56_11095 [Cetobacterium sp. 2A]|uniref:hypothetical protein n=1 Tax=Cetobacterium sp. 2A TaxID=2754723 RepID=UPI00163CA039|nr:hypothetical protein [Cetobacterium sp. 2A]MBC2856978.1 hypothetical protein [Cetobacterium sp. 2A]